MKVERVLSLVRGLIYALLASHFSKFSFIAIQRMASQVDGTREEVLMSNYFLFKEYTFGIVAFLFLLLSITEFIKAWRG